MQLTAYYTFCCCGFQMDKSNKTKSSVDSTKIKLEEIGILCAPFGNTAKYIIKKITDKLDDLSDECTSLIDALWKSIKGLKSGVDKNIIIEAMKILSCVLALFGFAFPMCSVASYAVFLVAYFLKVIFHIINLKKTIDPKVKSHDSIRHDLAGLAEKLEKTVIFIDAVDDEEHVDESTLKGLLSNVDIHIGVSELGNLKSRIKILMSGGEEDWRTCLEFLKMFVRISTLRHSLLFRMLTCLRAKDYSRGTVSVLQKYIMTERKDNQTFLAFFSAPSLESVGVLTIFNPTEEEELITYLEQLRLSFQNLRSVLHDQVFLVSPITNPHIVFGRPFTSVHSVRSMKSSTDVENVRIRFKFKAIANEVNLFHIQSPDLGEYVFMKKNSYCKYSKSVKDPDTAKWRIILVQNTEEKDETQCCFIICTRKWPAKFLICEKSFYECVRGLETNTKPSIECLFTVCSL